MRLNYNGILIVNDDQTLEDYFNIAPKVFKGSKSGVFEIEIPKKEEVTFLKSYSDYFDYMNDCCSYFEEDAFMVFIEEKRALTFIRKDSSERSGINEFVLKTVWEFELPEFKDLYKDILRLKENGDGRFLVSTFSNYFSFITNPGILKTIFHFKELEVTGVTPYRRFKIKKKHSNKMRDITAPEEVLKSHLRECNELFQKVFDGMNSSFQVAYKKGKSVRDNAAIHKNHKYIYNMDLCDFYPSCKRSLVSDVLERVFGTIFNGKYLKELFMDATLYEDALFIGNPFSGCIANRIIAPAASYMKNIAKKFGCEFSIYADDVTFSSDRFISTKFANGILKQGLVMFELETTFLSNQDKEAGFSNSRRVVTGVPITDNNQVTVRNEIYRYIRSALNHLHYGTFDDNLNRVRGRIAFALMLDESGKVKKLLSKYKYDIEKYHILKKEKLDALGI